MKKINFYSGPSILPQEVLDGTKAAIDEFADTGLSILEISHRAKPFVEVMDGARALVKELMGLGDEYEVLYLHGGASSQFYMIPYNLLDTNETAGYIDTGTWAHGALTEAKLFGKVHVIASSKDTNYDHIPKQWDLSAKPYKYIHITTNNTIYGAQWDVESIRKIRAQCDVLVGDMSSDIFSREIDYSMFDVIYAGAQKNMGVAGATVVVIKKSVLGTVKRDIPKMLDYRVHIETESMKNTPSVFAVYASYLTLQWIKKQGLQNISSVNQRKADKLYKAIDESNLFVGNIAKEDRSMMNVCWVMKDKSLEPKFNEMAKSKGIVGIEGHRSVGGFRASIYNAMPESGVDVLIRVMKEFESSYAQ
ncbi:MAG: 3-phosphoserine/phosphohydroxythreonine aminotransferase [Bacteroidetes bacterium]|nr:3-phosphoserine/phosphohydroxythreonine aminotransferase [Bacteroidota bacterium]